MNAHDPFDNLPPVPPLEAYQADRDTSAKKKEDDETAKRAAQIASFREGVFRASDLVGKQVP